MSFLNNNKNNYSQHLNVGNETSTHIHHHPKIVLPNVDIYTEEHHKELMKSINKNNTLSPLPPPSFELFEHIGQDEKFQEECSDKFFCELFLLFYPSNSNASILFFQNSLHKLILSKNDFDFLNEFFITKNKEPHNAAKINASIGAIHYIYLLYYDWLSSLKNFSHAENYQEKLLHFFQNYNLTHKFILKYELAKQIKYTSNFFNQNTKATQIFQDLLSVGQYISAYIQSQFTINTHLFRPKLHETEIEYLFLVKKFILEGEEEIGKTENLKITQEQLISICKSSVIENHLSHEQSGLWIHLQELQKFYLYAQRYNLLKTLHASNQIIQNGEDEDDETGGNQSEDLIENGAHCGNERHNNPKKPKNSNNKKVYTKRKI